MTRSPALVLVFAATLTCLSASAGEWPQFRGPNSNNLPDDANLPTVWTPEQNVAWKVPISGHGWSSPILWGDRVFVTTAVEEEAPKLSKRNRLLGGIYRWEVHCFDLASGKQLWKKVATRGEPQISTHQGNGYASETPVTDGELVYAYFGMTGLFAYDMNGNLAWKKDLGSFQMQRDWGTGSSPLIYGGKLYLQIDSDEDSFLVALNPKNGEEIWRFERDEASNWSTPMIWKNKERIELVTNGRTARSYDPESGKLLWSLKVGGRCSASPTGDEDYLYIGSEKRSDGGALFAIKAGASGDITPAEGEEKSAGVAWSNPKAGPPMASPFLYKGVIYVVARHGGIVTSYDAKTGEEIYKQRLPEATTLLATPWAYDDRVFCLDKGGTVHALKPGREFEILGANSLEGEFWASPAMAHGAVIFRSMKHLYCIRQSAASGGTGR